MHHARNAPPCKPRHSTRQLHSLNPQHAVYAQGHIDHGATRKGMPRHEKRARHTLTSPLSNELDRLGELLRTIGGGERLDHTGKPVS